MVWCIELDLHITSRYKLDMLALQDGKKYKDSAEIVVNNNKHIHTYIHTIRTIRPSAH